MPTRSRAATYARRRKRRMALVDHDLTADQWVALMTAWGGCAYCGADGAALQKDCMLPISRGGRYTVSNVVPACRSCNASKCNLEVTTWMRRKSLDEGRFLLRQIEVLRLVAPMPTP
ncbi:MAG: HNH endonuclease [Aeromicrobium sp.]